MIFTEFTENNDIIFNEANLFGQKIDVKRLQDEEYCRQLVENIKSVPESEYQDRAKVQKLLENLEVIALFVTVAIPPLILITGPALLLVSRLSKSVTSEAELKRCTKVIDKIIESLENAKKYNPNDKSIQSTIDKLRKNKALFDNKTLVVNKISLENKDKKFLLEDKYYNGTYFGITSLTGMVVEDIWNGKDYESLDLNKDELYEYKDSYPVEYIEQIAAIPKSEWVNRFKSNKNIDSGDYYKDQLSDIDVNKHYIEILDWNSNCNILYCIEDKTCYITSFKYNDPFEKCSFDKLYSMAKECFNDYLRLCNHKPIKESYIGGSVNMDNEVLCFSGNNGGSYIQDALYESYIQAKIDSEERLALALKESMIISEADYSNIRAIREAKFSDKVKNTWKRFIAFIKGLVAKFMESMSNILLDEKAYLEKYKDIILKKRPKDDMKYSYTGDYQEGIKRLIKVDIPLFNYETYKQQLEAESDGPLAKAIIGNDFKYDDGSSLAEQFKNYFLNLDAGEKEGKFSDLNMTDLYNFCYNFKKIKEVVDKDINRLEQSTRAIETMINKALNVVNNQAAGDKVNNQATNTGSNTNNKASATVDGEKVKADVVDKDGKVLASAILRGNNYNILSEKVDIKQDEPSTSAASKMGSTQDKDESDEKNAAYAGASTAVDHDKEEADITKAANKWISVCRPIIAAKLTAYQQIAKDYMDIIRAHVRSYGGQSKKSKEGDKAPQTGTQYSKHPEVNQAQQDAQQAQQDANQNK